MKVYNSKKYQIIINKYQLNSYCLNCLKNNILLVDKIEHDAYKVILRLNWAELMLLREALNVDEYPQRIVELPD